MIDLFLVLVLIPVGLLAGFLAGLFGIGGGIILVPAIYYVQSLTGASGGGLSAMHVAVGTSLAVIVPTGMSSALAHWRHGSVRFDILSRLAPGVVIGATAGIITAAALDGPVLKVLFACVISVLAAYMILSPDNKHVLKASPHPVIHILAGAGIGSISTLIGIGGATLSVPFMRSFATPVTQSVGTASVIGLLISIPGAIGFLVLGLLLPQSDPVTSGFSPLIGYIHWLGWLIIVPCSVLMAPFGVKAAHKVSEKLLKRLFALFMILVSLKMLSEGMGL